MCDCWIVWVEEFCFEEKFLVWRGVDGVYCFCVDDQVFWLGECDWDFFGFFV